jgi:hypothetical protein
MCKWARERSWELEVRWVVSRTLEVNLDVEINKRWPEVSRGHRRWDVGEISGRGGRIVVGRKPAEPTTRGITFIERDEGYVGPKGGVFVWGLWT